MLDRVAISEAMGTGRIYWRRHALERMEAMKSYSGSGVCAVCGGTMEAGHTTFTAELGFGVVVVRDVPARVCPQCGTDWIADSQAAAVERIVEEARARHRQVEVASLAS